MTTKQTIVILLLLLPHVILALRAQLQLFKNSNLSKGKIILHSILNWLLIYMWPLIVMSLLKAEENSVKAMTRKRRKELQNSGSNTDNWQNLTGFGG